MENTIFIILILIPLWVFIRNIKVCKFRKHIADLIYSRVCELINDGAYHLDIFRLWDMLDDIPYERMLFSLKPLKMKYWFTDEELKLLGYESKRLD